MTGDDLLIPKKIHYCWFGRNPKPELAEKCIESWKKFCSDYEIIEWNEDNYDIQSAPLFVRQAYEAKKWAFVTDYVRLEVVYKNGGVYLDTDVEVIKELDELLKYRAFFGRQNESMINTGLGFGAESFNPFLKSLMTTYHCIAFLKEDGSYDTTPCPERDTKVFFEYGLNEGNSLQIIFDGIACLPIDYLSPKDYMTGKLRVTDNTYTIHHFAESWMSEIDKNKMKEIRRTLYHPTIKERTKRRIVKTIGHKNIERVRKIFRH